MKKIFVFSLVALFVCSAGITAQKGNKPKTVTINNRIDSISYALGHNMTNGLKTYLMTAGVLKDTAANALIEGYTAKLNGTDEAGKTALKKELGQKQKEAEKANNENFEFFLKGLESALGNVDQKTNSYNTGIGIGNQLSSVQERFEKEVLSDSKLNRELFLAAIMFALNDKEPLMQDAEAYIQQVAMEAQQAEEIKRAEELQALHGERVSEGVKFLAENKTKEGVVILPSGLQYKIITEGSGEKPTLSDQVKVHYEGRLLDGTVFDSSYNRGEPATFGLTQVIRGWTEVLQEMPVGSKWVVYIPHNLAYGERDQGLIKPFSTLVFDIELLGIEK